MSNHPAIKTIAISSVCGLAGCLCLMFDLYLLTTNPLTILFTAMGIIFCVGSMCIWAIGIFQIAVMKKYFRTLGWRLVCYSLVTPISFAVFLIYGVANTPNVID